MKKGLTVFLLVLLIVCSSATHAQDWWGVITKEIPEQDDFFILEFDLVPRAESIKRAHVLLSGIPPLTWGDNACIVRVNADNGLIDVRNGASYAAETEFAYEAGKSYHVRMAVDVGAYAYDVSVNELPDGEVFDVFVGSGFRTDQVNAGLEVINQVHVTPPYASEDGLIDDPGADLHNIIIVDESGATIWEGENLIYTDPSGIAVAEETALPVSHELSQNYPNPFNPSTQIAFRLPQQEQVTLKVYSILGQEMARVINMETLPAGQHIVTFDASELSSGVYIYRLETGSKMLTRKMTYLR